MPDATIKIMKVEDIAGTNIRLDSNVPKNLIPFRISWDGSGTKSEAIWKAGMDLVGIQFPAKAQNLSFEVSVDGVTFAALDIDAVDMTTAKGKSFNQLAEWPYFKVVSSGAPDAGFWWGTMR